MRSVRFLDDTLREMSRWAARRYRVKFDVLFSGSLRSGRTSLFRTGPALIELSTRRTHSALVEVLAHEIAHVVSGDRGHGPIFRRSFSRLIAEWNSHAKGGVQ